jgi:hypothetical protein
MRSNLNDFDLNRFLSSASSLAVETFSAGRRLMSTTRVKAVKPMRSYEY